MLNDVTVYTAAREVCFWLVPGYDVTIIHNYLVKMGKINDIKLRAQALRLASEGYSHTVP